MEKSQKKMWMGETSEMKCNRINRPGLGALTASQSVSHRLGLSPMSPYTFS